MTSAQARRQLWPIAGYRWPQGPTSNAVPASQQNIPSAALTQFVHDPQPELGTLVLLKPQTQHLLRAIGADTKSDVDSFIANHAFIADLDADRVEENERIDRIERSLLPRGDFRGD